MRDFNISSMGLHGKNEVKSMWCRLIGAVPPSVSKDVISGKMGSYGRLGWNGGEQLRSFSASFSLSLTTGMSHWR